MKVGPSKFVPAALSTPKGKVSPKLKSLSDKVSKIGRPVIERLHPLHSFQKSPAKKLTNVVVKTKASSTQILSERTSKKTASRKGAPSSAQKKSAAARRGR